MTNDSHDIDVAISFANEDLGLATEIRDGLGNAFNVFVYTARQEELAGTDGLKSFREVFRHRARLVVILLRGRWGKTPWTRVEEEAITDRYLKEGPNFLFVVMLDGAAPPKWIPEKLIRFSLKDFGTQQAIGAIKARALESGSTIHRPTPALLAQRSQELSAFAEKRERLRRSAEGVQAAADQAKALIALVSARVAETKQAAPSLGIEYGAETHWFVLRTRTVSLHCSYQNRITNVLDEAQLVIREIRGQLLLPAQNGYYIREPIELSRSVFLPDLARDLGWCWRSRDGAVHTSSEVADRCIERFFSLVDRDTAGILPDLEM